MPVKGGQKLKRFIRGAKAAQARGVKKLAVGFFSDARYPDGTPVTAVAAWNEFGTQGRRPIPERPFMRNSADDFPKLTTPVMRDGLDSRTMEVTRPLAGRVGLVQESRIKQEIVTLKEPANAEATIVLKKSSNPLIDTGFMRMSVTYRIDG